MTVYGCVHMCACRVAYVSVRVFVHVLRVYAMYVCIVFVCVCLYDWS